MNFDSSDNVWIMKSNLFGVLRSRTQRGNVFIRWKLDTALGRKIGHGCKGFLCEGSGIAPYKKEPLLQKPL